MPRGGGSLAARWAAIVVKKSPASPRSASPLLKEKGGSESVALVEALRDGPGHGGFAGAGHAVQPEEGRRFRIIRPICDLAKESRFGYRGGIAPCSPQHASQRTHCARQEEGMIWPLVVRNYEHPLREPSHSPSHGELESNLLSSESAAALLPFRDNNLPCVWTYCSSCFRLRAPFLSSFSSSCLFSLFLLFRLFSSSCLLFSPTTVSLGRCS